MILLLKAEWYRGGLCSTCDQFSDCLDKAKRLRLFRQGENYKKEYALIQDVTTINNKHVLSSLLCIINLSR